MSSVRLVLESDTGEPLVSRAIERPFLVPNGRDVVVRSRTDDEILLRLRPTLGAGDDRGDVPVGSLPILTVRHGKLEIEFLQLPPPAPFSTSDISAMWEATARLPGGTRTSRQRDSLTRAMAGRTRSPTGASIVALPQVVEAAQALLARWPLVDRSVARWRAVALPGGREDIARSLRQGSASRLQSVGGAESAARTIRRMGAFERWTLRTLAAVVREVARRFSEDSAGDELVLQVKPLLTRVADGLDPVDSRSIDPPLSAWPPQMRGLLDACTWYLAELSAVAVGDDYAPICHLWEIYEGWVSYVVLDELERLLGPPSHGPEVASRRDANVTFRTRWDRGDERSVEYWSQLEVQAQAAAHGPRLRSVSAPLVPDGVLLIESPGETLVVVLDAKHRSSGMTLGDLSNSTAKYLWGLRSDLDSAHHLVDSAVVVTSARRPPVPFDRAVARMSAVAAIPGDDSDLRNLVSLLVSDSAVLK